MAFVRRLFCLLPAWLLIVAFLVSPLLAHADSADPAAGDKKKDAGPPDLIVFTNGDQLSGKFLREVGGAVFFHSDIVGDVSVKWDKIKELRSSAKVVVLEHEVGVHTIQQPSDIAMGTITVAGEKIEVHPEVATATIEPIPVKNAQYIVDQVTFNKQLRGTPGFFTGWNGAVTAGATIVQATQNQYTFTGSVGLARVVPTVLWMERMSHRATPRARSTTPTRSATSISRRASTRWRKPPSTTTTARGSRCSRFTAAASV
jgi:hypothetical protein